MIGTPAEHAVDGACPSVEVEARQAVHEIDAQIGAARVARRLERGSRAARVMEPAEPRENRVVEGLHAEAQPIHAAGAIALELRAGHALGITFDGDLGVGDDVEPGADPIEHRRQRLGLHERRRAAAEEDRPQPDPRRPRQRSEQIDLALDRLEVADHGPVLERRRIEAAVPAPLRAERHMHVQPQSLGFWCVVRQE